MSLTSDQKLDILIILFAVWLLVFILSVAFKIKLFVSGNDPSKCIERLNIRDNKGDYSGMLEIANWFLEKQPENADIKWAKGRALFKLQKYEEAQAVFQEIASTEPLWKTEANQYIEAIIEKNT